MIYDLSNRVKVAEVRERLVRLSRQYGVQAIGMQPGSAFMTFEEKVECFLESLNMLTAIRNGEIKPIIDFDAAFYGQRS